MYSKNRLIRKCVNKTVAITKIFSLLNQNGFSIS